MGIEFLAERREAILRIAESYGARNVRVFGSLARGDAGPDSDVDFEEDLGLGLYGDRVELSFSNRPVMRYFRLDRKSSLSLELKITSVLLGERNDDTYISEVDLVELIPATSQPDSKPTGAKPGSGKPDAPKDKPAAADDWTEDDF